MCEIIPLNIHRIHNHKCRIIIGKPTIFVEYVLFHNQKKHIVKKIVYYKQKIA